jgi:glycosyltransferase A (GT-A) superfamily protein (DUF2064 family)
MLEDKIYQALLVPDIQVFVALPETVTEENCRTIACGCPHIFQYGPDLGARLVSCAEAVYDMGYLRVLLVDSDSPTLPVSFYSQGLALLKDREDRIVLGPTEDGGYYLIGMSRLYRSLFQGILWSTPGVLQATMEKARSLGIDVELLPVWYDIDMEQDLNRLMVDLDDPLLCTAAPKTASWLRKRKLGA